MKNRDEGAGYVYRFPDVLLISILKNVHGTGGYGYDISKQAINVAKENAKLNDVPAIFERSNLFEDVAA